MDTDYTYQCGQKVPLSKRPDQFVIRTDIQDLKDVGFRDTERMSPASIRVTVPESELDVHMDQLRKKSVAHHAYDLVETGEELLITDRLFVTFRDPITPEQVAVFAGKYGLVERERYSDRELLFQLTNHTHMNPVKLVVKLTEQDDTVEMAEHDLNHRVTRYQELNPPSDPDYQRQWHLHTHFQDTEFDPRASSNCEEAWQLLDNFGSSEVVVGVTDDGCKLDHRDFDSQDKFSG